MNYKALFKGEYIAAVEIGDKIPTLTISDVRLVSLESLGPIEGADEGRGPKVRERGVIHFRETPRGWVLNRTNAECLAAMFGPETADWIGKRVTLCAELVQVGRKREPGIRVKGSPDLAAPVTATIALPRKRPVERKLVPTGRANGSGAQAQRPPPPLPSDSAERDPFTGEEVPPALD